MKANTLTELGNVIGFNKDYTISNIEYVGLLYKKRNYEFHMCDLDTGINYLVRSNGPCINTIFESKTENIPVVLFKKDNGKCYIDFKKEKKEADFDQTEQANLEDLLEQIAKHGLGISKLASNSSKLILTPLPTVLYNKGVETIKSILNDQI